MCVISRLQALSRSRQNSPIVFLQRCQARRKSSLAVWDSRVGKSYWQGLRRERWGVLPCSSSRRMTRTRRLKCRRIWKSIVAGGWIGLAIHGHLKVSFLPLVCSALSKGRQLAKLPFEKQIDAALVMTISSMTFKRRRIVAISVCKRWSPTLKIDCRLEFPGRNIEKNFYFRQCHCFGSRHGLL